jgi:hypothetical protein
MNQAPIMPAQPIAEWPGKIMGDVDFIDVAHDFSGISLIFSGDLSRHPIIRKRLKDEEAYRFLHPSREAFILSLEE